MQDFKKLRVWQLSREFVSDIYKITESFPKHELYAMTSQLCRASYSIPSNIAEGCGKASPKEFRRYLNIAMGSAKEIECFLILANDLKYINKKKFDKLKEKSEIIGKMLWKLRRS